MEEVNGDFGRLSERVDSQGRAFDDFRKQTQDNFADLRIGVTRQFADFKSSITAEFTEVRSTFLGLSGKLDAFAQSTADKSRTNWFGLIGTGLTAIGVSSGLIAGLMSLRLAPVEDRLLIVTNAQSSIVSDLKILTTSLESQYMPRSEIEVRGKSTESALDRLGRQIEKLDVGKVDVSDMKAEHDATAIRSQENRDRIIQLRERVIKVEDNIVSRREHEIRNATVDHALDEGRAIERHDIDEVKARLDQLYPASTFLKDLNERTRQLEATLAEVRARK